MTAGHSDRVNSGYEAGQSDRRPWGRWTVIAAAPDFVVKTIEVRAGQRLSLQYHAHRCEHWVVVKGQGIVTIGDTQKPVTPGSHVFIDQTVHHRIENDGSGHLIFVEVQMGACLDEDDIVRIADDYQRAPTQGDRPRSG